MAAKIIGILMLAAGIGIGLLGYDRYNQMNNTLGGQFMQAVGGTDNSGQVVMGFGIVLGLIGLFLLLKGKKASSSN